MSNLPEKEVTKHDLASLATGLANAKASRERDASDITAQIEKLTRERSDHERAAHIFHVKQMAVRAAIRVMEDHGIA